MRVLKGVFPGGSHYGSLEHRSGHNYYRLSYSGYRPPIHYKNGRRCARKDIPPTFLARFTIKARELGWLKRRPGVGV